MKTDFIFAFVHNSRFQTNILLKYCVLIPYEIFFPLIRERIERTDPTVMLNISAISSSVLPILGHILQ